MRDRYKIFQEPQRDMYYSIGVDVSEGIEGHDHSAMHVIDKDLNEVASFYSYIAPDLLGVEACKLGEYYNKAILCIEVNNHGLTTVNKVRDSGYLNIYTREVKEERSDKLTKKLGWNTNIKTKTVMLDKFVACYRDAQLIINDVDLLKEMLTLTVENDGTISLNGKDRVVAMCLAIQGLSQANYNRYKAIVPGKVPMEIKTIEDKLKYYNIKKDRESGFE